MDEALLALGNAASLSENIYQKNMQQHGQAWFCIAVDYRWIWWIKIKNTLNIRVKR